jgi:stress response protein YsnF
MPVESSVAERPAKYRSGLTNTAIDAVMGSGLAWFDLMMNFQREMQRASLQSFSSYSPTADTRITGRMPKRSEGVQVISVGEERLNVATRTVQGETTRLRRRVIAQPIEQQVRLRDEKVIVEHRPPTGANPKPDVLTETVIEMSDSHQVPTVWKSQHVAGEVVLRKQVSQRTEQVRETVRRDVVDEEREPAFAPAHEIEGHAEVVSPRHEGEVEQRAKAHVESFPDKRQQDEPQDKKLAQGLQSPAPQPAGRK